MNSNWRERRSAAERWITKPPVGGAVADDAGLDLLAAELLAIASACGYPHDDSRTAAFDADTAVHLAQLTHMRDTDALRDDVWAFIATVLVPEIVRWRYGDQEERHRGGVRNVFQRVWLRAAAADRGPDAGDDRWTVVRALVEDAAVAIVERPGLSGAQRVARALTERWYAERQNGTGARLDKRLRWVARNLLVTNQVKRLELLPQSDLEAEVDRLFLASVGK